jgi:hypothetical protein
MAGGKAAKAAPGKMAAKKATPPVSPSKTPTKAQRQQMPASDFGLPATKQYPIDTPGRARNALARAAQNATPSQQAQIARRVKAKYPTIDKPKGK